MKPEVYDLSKLDVIHLEGTLESKISMIYKSLGILVVILILAFFYQILRGRSADIAIFLIVGIVIYTPFFCLLWFGYIAKIRRDLQELKKIKFKTKIIDKAQDNVLGIEECSFFLDNNEAGIEKVNVEREIFDSIPLFSYVLIDVAIHSKTYIGCEIINEEKPAPNIV